MKPQQLDCYNLTYKINVDLFKSYYPTRKFVYFENQYEHFCFLVNRFVNNYKIREDNPILEDLYIGFISSMIAYNQLKSEVRNIK